MTETGMDVVNELIAAVHAEDNDRIAAVFAPDAKILEAENLPYPGTFTGVEGFHFLKAKIAELADLDITDWQPMQAGDRVVVTMTGVLTSKATGRTVRMPIVEIYTVKDDLITEIDVFYKDTAKMSVLFAERG